jgi:hypothetical protein
MLVLLKRDNRCLVGQEAMNSFEHELKKQEAMGLISLRLQQTRYLPKISSDLLCQVSLLLFY